MDDFDDWYVQQEGGYGNPPFPSSYDAAKAAWQYAYTLGGDHMKKTYDEVAISKEALQKLSDQLRDMEADILKQPASPAAEPWPSAEHWKEEARRYCQNSEYWRKKYEEAPALRELSVVEIENLWASIPYQSEDQEIVDFARAVIAAARSA